MQPRISATSLALAFPAVWLAGCLAAAGEFPMPDELPSRSGLPDPLVMLDGRQGHDAGAVGRPAPAGAEVAVPTLYVRQDAARTREDRGDRRAQGAERVSAARRRGPRSRSPSGLPTPEDPPPPGRPRTGREGARPRLPRPELPGQPHGPQATRRSPLPTAWVPERPRRAGNKATEAGRGSQEDVWAVEELIGRGYALATFYCGDVAPDHPGLRRRRLPPLT